MVDLAAGSMLELAGNNTIAFQANVEKTGLSSVQSYVFFGDDDATISAVHTFIPMKMIVAASTATMVRVSNNHRKMKLYKNCISSQFWFVHVFLRSRRKNF